jgi:hypothetical protein
MYSHVFQFIECCTSGKNEELTNIVIEHIMAMDDFLSFKKLMEKRNIELEVEAMSALQEQQEKQEQQQKGDKEEQDFEFALQASIQEQEFRDRQKELEDAELQMAIAMSLSLLDEEAKRQLEAIQAFESTKQLKQQEEQQQQQLEQAKEQQQKQQTTSEVKQPAEVQTQVILPEIKLKPTLKPIVTPRDQKVVTEELPASSDDTAKQLIHEAENDSKKLAERLDVEKKKQEDAIQRLLAEKHAIKKELSEMERLEAEKFQKLKQQAETLKKKQQEQHKPDQPFSISDSGRKELMLAEKQKLIEAKKVHREETMKQFLNKQRKQTTATTATTTTVTSQPTKAVLAPIADNTKDQMRDALARRLREELLSGKSNTTTVTKQPSVEPTSENTKEIDKTKLLAKKKLLDSMIKNASIQSSSADDYSYSEL